MRSACYCCGLLRDHRCQLVTVDSATVQALGDSVEWFVAEGVDVYLRKMVRQAPMHVVIFTTYLTLPAFSGRHQNHPLVLVAGAPAKGRLHCHLHPLSALVKANAIG